MLDRDILPQILKRENTKKATLIIGPRQVGKTTLINMLMEGKNCLFLDGDDFTTQTILAKANTEDLKAIIGNHTYLVIDEAQRIPNIGLKIKIIIDKIKNVFVYISGSSSIELGGLMNEPLTGRKWEYLLLPIAWGEYVRSVGKLKALQQLETRLVFGMYPEVINTPTDQAAVLKQLTSSYLYKDILTLTNIKKPEILDKILFALAYQLGHEVSYNELAQTVGVDKNTIQTYIDLLSKAFVIFILPSFSRNLRNEIKTNKKIYFYDNGIRNTIIGQFDPIAIRNDVGALWENFLMSERLKFLNHQESLARMYFWRTNTQKEIDYIELDGNIISAYEFKWSEKSKINHYKDFESSYETTIKSVNRNNFEIFLGILSGSK